MSRLVVQHLVGRGERVRVLAAPGMDAGWPAEVEIRHGSLSDPDDIGSAFTGVDRALLTGLSPDSVREVGRLSRRAGVRRVVLLSSAAAGRETAPDPRSGPFRFLERAVEESSTEWTHLRPAALMADTLRWAEPIRSLGVVREPFGAFAYPLLHEDDLAAVAVAALTESGHTGRVYELTGPEAISQVEQVRLIGEAIGRPIRFEELDEDETRELWLAVGRPAEEVDLELFVMSEFTSEPAPVDDTLARVLGRPPKTYARWAAEHADAFR